MRVAREGVPFILLPLALAALTSSFGWVWVGGTCFIAALKMAFFFRDPVRQTPQDDSLIYSPADGKIIEVEKVSLPFPATRVSIFLSLFNVHITRAPIAGTVKTITAEPGRYIAAYKAAASEKNARVSVHIQGSGTEVFFRQVSGSLARRVRSYVREGDTLRAGQKTGIIYFGSRVDIFLPDTVDITIRPGQKVRAGETVIAKRAQ
jgi:phosphatidylserine decarboxylase